MAPKTRSQTRAANQAKASSARQIDEFIGESEVADTQELRALSQGLESKRVKELNDKYFNLESTNAVMHNRRNVTQGRILCTVWIGMACGIFNCEALQGILFYAIADAILSLVIAVRYGFSAKPYFLNFLQMITSGFMGNSMTFLVSWVLFYNLVYIL